MVKSCSFRPTLLHVSTFSCIGYLCGCVWEKAATKFHVNLILCTVIGVDYVEEESYGTFKSIVRMSLSLNG